MRRRGCCCCTKEGANKRVIDVAEPPARNVALPTQLSLLAGGSATSMAQSFELRSVEPINNWTTSQAVYITTLHRVSSTVSHPLQLYVVVETKGIVLEHEAVEAASCC